MKMFLLLIAVTFVVNTAHAAEQVPVGAIAVVNEALGIAKTGFKEGPRKKTPFGDWAGMPNQAWCGSFASWCYAKAGFKKLVSVQSGKPFTSCWIALAQFEKDKRIVSTSEAMPGDLVFFRFGDGTRANHVGIVVENHSDEGYLLTCEGNTTPPGDSKSGIRGAYVKRRQIDSSVVAIVHLF